MYITQTSRGWIGILTDREEYMEAEELDKWFQNFIDENGLILSPHTKKIDRIWLSLSTAERLRVRADVIRRMAACKKSGVNYAETVRGIFFETDAAVRVQSDEPANAGSQSR